MPLSLYFTDSAWPHLTEIFSDTTARARSSEAGQGSLILSPDRECLEDIEHFLLDRGDVEDGPPSLALLTLRDFWPKVFGSLPQNYRPAPLILQRRALIRALRQRDPHLKLDTRGQIRALREISRFVDLKALRPDWRCPKIYPKMFEEIEKGLPPSYRAWSFAPVFAKLRHELDRRALQPLQKMRRVYFLGFSRIDAELFQSVETLRQCLPETRLHVILPSKGRWADPEGFYAPLLERLESWADEIREETSPIAKLEVIGYPSPLHESRGVLRGLAATPGEGLALTPAYSATGRLLENYFARCTHPNLPSRLPATRHTHGFEILEAIASETVEDKTDFAALFSQRILPALQSAEQQAASQGRAESLRSLQNLLSYLFHYAEAEKLDPREQNVSTWISELREEFLELHLDYLDYSRQRVPLRSLEHPGLKTWDHLWIANLSEGAYPSAPFNPILSDADFASLDQHDARLKLEQCYFLARKVELSFAQTSLSGRSTELSSLLAGLGRKGRMKLRDELDWIDAGEHPYFEENVQREAERHHGESCNLDSGDLSRLDLGPILLERFQSRPLSASYVDEFAKCPWRFFARWHLRLEDEIEEDLEIEARRRGQWMHRLLERVFKALREEFFEQNEIPDAARLQAVFEQGSRLFEEEILTAERAGEIPEPVLKNQLRTIARQAWRLLEEEHRDWLKAPRRLFPRHLEWSFGRQGNPPLRFDLDAGLSVPFSGIIDRIDVSDAGEFLIIDYKASNSESLAKRLRERQSFQLLIYLEAVQKILFQDKKAIGGLYWDLKETKKNQGMAVKDLYQSYSTQSLRTKSFLSEESYQELCDDLRAELQQALRRIVSGDYSLKPKECLNRYCHFNEICRYADKDS